MLAFVSGWKRNKREDHALSKLAKLIFGSVGLRQIEPILFV